MAIDKGLPQRSQVPEGVKDRLPREAARVRELSAQLDATFRVWGYREVLTPAFEYLDSVATGTGRLTRREDLYQFFDRRGRTLALRPDMTAPIARLAATKLGSEPLPLRLSYLANVFRHRETRAGAMHEIWQAGVELIGAGGALADAEMVALACAALAEAGLSGFQIGIGHVDLVEGLFAEVGVGAALADELRTALVARDLVAYEKAVAAAGLPGEQVDLLLALTTFHGDFAAVRARFGGLRSPRVQRALQQIGDTLVFLEAYGVVRQVSLDPGLTRALGYYTGIVFEGYAPGVGAPVLGGGRYDNLLLDYGQSTPATGFALDIERLLVALERAGRPAPDVGPEVVVGFAPGYAAAALTLAQGLRQEGRTVEVDLVGRDAAALHAYAEARSIAEVIFVQEEVRRVNLPRAARINGPVGIH
jgi:ATP phosphoribosyltransferase regulatory subunit